jgi:hypothetical protein
MVAPQEKEVFGVLYLVAEEKEDGFETLLPAVDIVAEEEVVGGWWEATHFEQAYEIRVLAMHVTDNFDGRRELNEGGLAEEDLACGLAYGGDLCVLEAEGLGDLAGVSDVEEALDHIIDIKRLELVLRAVGVAVEAGGGRGTGSEGDGIGEDGGVQGGIKGHGARLRRRERGGGERRLVRLGNGALDG